MKKQLFKGTVEAIYIGGMNKSEICDFIDKYITLRERPTPVQFVEREIERIKQCGPFKHWIIYCESSQTYSFNNAIGKCPLDTIIYMIKYFYNKTKYNEFDCKMDLTKKNQRKEVTNSDYESIDKYINF